MFLSTTKREKNNNEILTNQESFLPETDMEILQLIEDTVQVVRYVANIFKKDYKHDSEQSDRNISQHHSNPKHCTAKP